MPEQALVPVQTAGVPQVARPQPSLLVDASARGSQQQAELKLIFMRSKQATINRRVSEEKMRRRALAALAGGGTAIGVKAILKLIFQGQRS